MSKKPMQTKNPTSHSEPLDGTGKKPDRKRHQRVRLDVHDLMSEEMRIKLGLPYFISGSELLTPSKTALLAGITVQELKRRENDGTGPGSTERKGRAYSRLIDVLRWRDAG